LHEIDASDGVVNVGCARVVASKLGFADLKSPIQHLPGLIEFVEVVEHVTQSVQYVGNLSHHGVV
jgi:hypothetical protein